MGTMTRRLSSTARSHTEDSIFLRPDDDPVWLDEPPTTTTHTTGEGGTPEPEGGEGAVALRGGAGGEDYYDDGEPPRDGDEPLPRETQIFVSKMTSLLVEGHCWAAVMAVQQLMGHWLFFVMLGFGPLSSIYKTLQVFDFYMAFYLSCDPLLPDTMMLMMEVVDCRKHRWIIHSTVYVGIALFCVMMVHLVFKYYFGFDWFSFPVPGARGGRREWTREWPDDDRGDGGGVRNNNNNNRRQSVSRQPSFTLSEWTDAQEDLLDLEPEPQTPVFELLGGGGGGDARAEGDAATLTVTPVGLQERRGSNVSLTLDMCTPGCTEPYGYGAQLSPRDQSAQEYLREGTHPLTPALLHTRALEDQALQAEFYETPMNFVDPKEYNYPGLVRKNRYKTILPNTHSRVILKSPDEEDFLTTYINANYLKGYGDEEKAYIATQGPTVNTVGDFWRMVWEERCPIIVMITNLEEKNEKCAEYWPEDTVNHEGIQITVATVTQEDDYSLRVFTLKCSGEERSLRQYWYTSWPDQKTPDKAPPLLELVQEVERAREEAPHSSGPTIVHCSAGIGRTGCFIATSILCRQLRDEGMVDILKTTCQLRLDRGGMIQTCEQYQFVHHVLSLYEKQLNHAAEE